MLQVTPSIFTDCTARSHGLLNPPSNPHTDRRLMLIASLWPSPAHFVRDIEDKCATEGSLLFVLPQPHA